jgi:hypothetical protein
VNAKNSSAFAFYARHGLVRTGTAYFELGGEKHENHVMISTPTSSSASTHSPSSI